MNCFVLTSCWDRVFLCACVVWPFPSIACWYCNLEKEGDLTTVFESSQPSLLTEVHKYRTQKKQSLLPIYLRPDPSTDLSTKGFE